GQMDPSRLSRNNRQTAATRSIIARETLADIRELGAIHAGLREIAARGNSPGPISHHHQVIHDKDRCLGHPVPIRQREADRRMRKLEIPLHTDAAVLYVPVRDSFAVKTEIYVVWITHARSSAAAAKSCVEQTVVKRESLFLVTEVHCPRLASHTQSNGIEGIEVPYQVAGHVLQPQ